MTGTIVRINEFGLCEVALPNSIRAAFTLDKLTGYGGQSFRDFGIREGAEVDLDRDEEGRVCAARLLHHGDAATAP